MSENGKAQSSLGELFVDFGTRGVGGLLKNLNTVSASFLLGKNAANQFAQTLAQPVKEAGNTAVAVGKLSTTLGTSFKEAYKFKMVMKKYNMDESLLGDISNFQKKIHEIQALRAAPDGTMQEALAQSNLLLNNYSSNLEDVMQFLDDLRTNISDKPIMERMSILRRLGFSEDWEYFWRRGGSLRESSLISDEEVEKNIEAQEAMSRMGTNMEQLKFTVISKLTPAVETIANFFGRFAQKTTKEIIEDGLVEPVKRRVKRVYNSVETGHLSRFGLGVYEQSVQQSIMKQNLITPPTMQTETGKTPPNVSNSTKNTNVTVNQDIKITAENAQEIVNSINRTGFNEALLQYQLHNSPSN